ncbi:Pisatin demethylase [Lasiodiplodia theobromae]|uniref:Pisatin demethylase n=1 Tax=Lasiodiplodia theobromae TaxID=45133 RepID=A0A5N5DC45_9PEZI|nr:Pisatin demethylase [Lasiodiplodia theobromae]
MGLTTYLIFLTLGIWLANKFLQAIRSPLRSVPGHFLARFTRLWYFKEVWTGTFPWTNIDLHQKHGPVVRIAPNEYSIDDPEAMKILYGHGTAFIKGPWYSASGVPHQANIFSDSNPKSHAVERRKFASLYSMSTLVTMEQAVDHCVDFLVDRLKEFSRSGATFDLQWWLQCFAFDTIGEISVSKRFGFLDAGNDALNIIDGLDNFLLYSARVGVFPETHPVIFKIVNMLGANGFQQVAKFATEQVQSYKKNVEGETFLGKALRIHQEQPQKLSETDILSICMMNVFAGSDTSSISLTSIMWCLLKNQHALAKAVIKEALRIHPATGLPLSRVVPKGGATISGHFFPEGTVVGVNTWVAHYNKQVFGQDAHEFRPERWLVSKEAQQSLDRYWLPFGHGSRTCIGKNIALMEISKVIPHLVRHFDLSLVDPNQEPTTHNVWFVKQQNIRVTAKVRDTTNL